MTGSFGLEEKHLYLLLQGQYYFTAGNSNHSIVCFTQCLFNMLGICTVGNCVSLLQGFWEHKSGIKTVPSYQNFLSNMLSAHLVRIVHRANIHVAWPVYVHWYCMPIATLNQNKQSRKLYFGNAQIMSTCWITSKFSSVCLQTCSSTLPILRPTYNLWNKIFIFLKLRHISN